MMESVFRAKRRIKGKVRVARTFTGQYRLAGDQKATRVSLGVSDKQVAIEKLRRIVREAEREREGLAPSSRQREAAQLPLEIHIREFVESRRGLARDEKYVGELEKKLLRLKRDCGWSTIRDVTSNSFEAWRARQSLTGKTLNEYRSAIFGLCHWLEGRVGTNPMRSVEKVNTSGAWKRERRALAWAELLQLVAVSAERGIVYLVAAWTGIRRGELEQIQWRDVHADVARPFITVRASIAKNHQLAHQPLPFFVAAALRQCQPLDVAPTDLVLKRLSPRMNRFRSDLAAAGIAYVDARGKYADFHALRKTYGTFLMLLGLPEFVRMKLMRHSDVRLTQQIYTDESMMPIWDAIAEPSILNDTQIDSQRLVGSGQSVSASVPIERGKQSLLTTGEQTFSPSESASVQVSPEVAENARCRVRTCDFLRVKQALYH
jgi:integrase